MQILDPSADEEFSALARDMGLDPEDQWVGRYVDYEWDHGRHIFQSWYPSLTGVRVLEFGCNYGASAIVLAALGADVAAVDVNADYIALAKLNAMRYGMADKIGFVHIPDTTDLPFDLEHFDCVSCNSVLEYIMPDKLHSVQQEIDRVLVPDGLILVTGTSNRLWPREVHSRKWLVNYLPRLCDPILFRSDPPERGVFPWQVVRGFGNYQNADLQDHGSAYLTSRLKIGQSTGKLRILRATNLCLNTVGLTVGMLTPSISVALQKR